jgi:hypothetical protein
MSTCASECDCMAPGGYPHEPDCHWWDKCDEDRSCDKHREEARKEHEYLRGMSRGAALGVMSEEEKQDLRDAGRGHLVP